MLPEDVDKLYVRSANGEMVHSRPLPLHIGCMALRDWSAKRSAVNGDSGGSRARNQFRRAMALMENLASQLPAGIGYD